MSVDVQSHENPQSSRPAAAADRDPLLAELDDDSTLADLISCNDTSVRLYNCVVKDPHLGQVSIGEYLSDPEAAFMRSLRTPNLGRKTAKELRSLIEAFALSHANRVHQVGAPAEQSHERGRAVQPKDVILAVLRQFQFPEALLQLDIGVRLRNVLEEFARCQRGGQEPGIQFRTLADVVKRWSEAAGELLKLRNFGKKSLDELRRATEDLLRRRLGKLIPADRLPPTLSLHDLHFSPSFERSLLELHPSLSEAVINPSDPQLVLESGIDIREEIEHIINILSKKEKDVLCRRFGLQGYRTKTLEEIGSEFYVTRQRVQQVEAKAIRRLQVPTRFAAFKYLLDREADKLWDALSLGSELLLPGDLEERHRNIDPIQQLAVTVVYGDLEKWASEAGTPFEAGWIRTDRSVEAVQSVIAAVRAYLLGLPLPRSLGGIAADLDIAPEDIALATRASGRFRVFEGYVIDGMVGPQARRTVRFHKAFLEQQDANLWDFNIARTAYLTRFPEDEVGSRVFDLQMRRAPHLFASIFDSVWLPLPDEGVAFRRTGTICYTAARYLPDSEFDDDTVRRWLVRKLCELGPTRAVDLRDSARAEFGQTILDSTIPAVLVMEPRFVRLAPGVFGLQEHSAALSEESAVFPNAFFSPAHCRYYIMARKAGEPMNLYPAWNFRFEAQLCSWSKLHHPNDLYRSLLHISTPENWPVSDEERTTWMRTKGIYGRYEFDALQTSVREATPPDGSHILAALAVLGTLGGLSWISVNRTAHRRLDNTHAVAGLALLVALSAIKPAQQWQDRHVPGADHSAVFARMAGERNRTGVSRWGEGSLRRMLEEALIKLPGRDLGWLNQNEAQALIEGLLESPATEVSTFEPIEPDEILGSDWSALFNE